MLLLYVVVVVVEASKVELKLASLLGGTETKSNTAASVVAATLAIPACTPRFTSWFGKHPPNQAQDAREILKMADAKQYKHDVWSIP